MSICTTCGEQTPDGFRFCGACGATLTGAETRRDVRKVVTVLFCDLAGYTSAGDQLDPEALRRVQSRYFEDARTALERHGGMVEKFIGEAVMAVACATCTDEPSPSGFGQSAAEEAPP